MRKIAMILILLLPPCEQALSVTKVGKFQAMYMVNFSKNLQWQSEEITIGVLGVSNVLGELELITSRYSNIRTKRIKKEDSIEDYQMIFIPLGECRHIGMIQEKIGDSQVVIVAENQKLIKNGAEFAFFMEGNKLKFLLNKEALEESGVAVTDKLVSLASFID